MFSNRQSAGQQLAKQLLHLRGEQPLVLALPRGGVPIGLEVAKALAAPLDVILVRKIGVPWQPELAIGAIVDGPNPQRLLDEHLIAELGIDRAYIRDECARQLAEIERRRKLYFGEHPPIPLHGRTVIVVDDGIATGATMRTALRAVRNAGAAKIIVATPLAPEDTLELLRAEADEVICLSSPTPFIAIGMHYADFTQVEDAEVLALLNEARRHEGRPDASQSE
ncbi:MAG TPA: phosphoribosyltransferase [Candidatus Competibacteraceae bacterium]|nr:phosphoribosyltransferase [Candidatus Competibacteraceae bacterium]